jgi:hypothetical protein
MKKYFLFNLPVIMIVSMNLSYSTALGSQKKELQNSRDGDQHHGDRRHHDDRLSINQYVKFRTLRIKEGHSTTEVTSAKPPKDKLSLDGHEIYEGRRILLDEESYPRLGATIVKGPTLQSKDGQTTIVFALDKYDDVLVRVVDAKGITIKNLGCGVLGMNAPAPFQKDSLIQKITWEGAEESLKAGHKVQVKVGCVPHFECFIAHDPDQLVKNVCGMEVDTTGRLYVSFFTERRGDTEIRRYDRQGKLLGTVYPPSPQGLTGTLSDVSRHVEHIEGQQAFPQRRGGWPFFIYKYHSARENDPTQFPFPFRVAPDGRAYVAEIVAGRVGLKPAEIDKLPDVKSRIFEVDLDPFWFLKRMAMGSGVWAIGPKGYGYLCCTNQQAINELRSISSASYKNERFIGNTIIKVSLDTLAPIEDFEFSGTEKLSRKRAYIGTLKTKGQGSEFFNSVRDLTIDQYGTLYVIDENRIKMYLANGRFIATLGQFTIEGQTQDLGDVHGIRAAGDSLYVVGRLGPITTISDKNKRRGKGTIEINGYRNSVLVKFKISDGSRPQAISSIPLNGLANVIAVDTSRSTPIVWVGNGGGEASFTRIEDKGRSLANVKHIRGIRKQVLKYPWSVAVDGNGRVYTYDYDRERLVRTNDDGSDWLESEKIYQNRSLFVDRKRGRLYRSMADQVVCMDLDFKDIKVNFPKGRRNLGGIDPQGNLILSGVGKTSFGTPVLKVRNRYGPDGFNGLIDRFSSDGTLQHGRMIEMYQGMGGMAVDSKGCIYVMDTCKAQFQYVAHDVGRLKYDGKTPDWKRGEKRIHNQSDMTYLVKFSPEGGKRGTEAELWAHRGASPVLSQCRCPVVTNTVAVDEADRIFHTDYLRYHVKILDTAGNVITRVGAWGNADNGGPESKHPQPAIAFSWLHGIDATNDALYASDRDLRRIVKVRLDYRETRITK